MPISRTFLTFRPLISAESRILTPWGDRLKYAQDLCEDCVFTAHLRSALLSAVRVMAASDAMTLTCNEIFHFLRHAANREFVHNQHIKFPMCFLTDFRIARLSLRTPLTIGVCGLYRLRWYVYPTASWEGKYRRCIAVKINYTFFDYWTSPFLFAEEKRRIVNQRINPPILFVIHHQSIFDNYISFFLLLLIILVSINP